MGERWVVEEERWVFEGLVSGERSVVWRFGERGRRGF